MILCDSCSPKRWCSVDKSRTECRFYQPMTNEEWRKTCSAEEFAEWITDKINAKLRMALNDAYLYDGDVDEKEYMEKEDEWVEWLKQPHTPIS